MTSFPASSLLKVSFLVLVLSCSQKSVDEDNDLKLWYRKPAEKWTDALPVGNGSLGAMIYGQPIEETIKLNHDTFWRGGPSDWNNPEAKKYIPLLKKALDTGDHLLADSLAMKMHGRETEPFQPLGDLLIRFDSGAIENYYRELDISTATQRTIYSLNGTSFTREAFASYPDSAIVMRFTSSSGGKLNFKASLSGIVLHKTWNEKGLLKMRSKAWNDPNWDREGMEAEVWLDVQVTGGKKSFSDSSVVVTGADEALLKLVVGTSFNGRFKSPYYDGKDPAKQANRIYESVEGKSFDELYTSHRNDYQSLFKRVNLDLPEVNCGGRPTDERIDLYQTCPDPGLVELLFQYGRYLLISSSRPGSQPANLQGIWSHHIYPPWRSNYTMNINAQMNYWPAEVTNLTETAEPVFDFVHDLAVNGAKTARINYGLDGWVVHHNSDIWAQTAPVEGKTMWANWTMGGLWHMALVFDHFQFTGDTTFLRSFYPEIKGAAQFAIGLLERNKAGYLETAFGTSPENQFVIDGRKVAMSKGTTMDLTLTYEILNRCKFAMTLFDPKDPFLMELKEVIAQLQPLRIGEDGRLLEWDEPYQENDPHHRHISHLYGVHPGNAITPFETPALFEAAKQSLLVRGDEATGWSMGWKINQWARMLDGNHALTILNNLMKTADPDTVTWERPGLYGNMFDAHPPFQIDGNFGATAGIAEMLLQSHAGAIHLLPAVPDTWPFGNVSGLCARGGFVIDMKWGESTLNEATIYSRNGGKCRIRSYWPLKITGAVDASGPCPNILMAAIPAKEPDKKPDGSVEIQLFEYDLLTRRGERYAVRLLK